MQRYDALVLGLGNLLWADEGFGVRAVEALHATFRFPVQVTLVEGGTLGLNLLGYVASSRRMLVLDAIDFGLLPGTLRVLRDREVPAWTRARLSAHQNGFNDVLALAELHGHTPETMVLIGVQPAELRDFGGGLSHALKPRLVEAVRVAEHELAQWGYPGTRRSPGESIDPLNAAALAVDVYENERPSAAVACRVGDPRLLRQP